MNSPTPLDQPVLPPAPWYTSPLQVQLVAAGISQVISLALRTVALLGYEIQVKEIPVDELGANLAQGLAFMFGGIAWWKRQRSQVAPLTMTKQAAKDLTQINPPLLASDPTKVPKA